MQSVQHVVALAVTRWDKRLAITFIILRHEETASEDYMSKHVQYEEENGPSISEVSSGRSNGDHVRQRCKVSSYVAFGDLMNQLRVSGADLKLLMSSARIYVLK